MFKRRPSSTLSLILVVAGIVAVVLVAALAGSWLGRYTAFQEARKESAAQSSLSALRDAGTGETGDVPFYLAVNTLPGADLAAVEKEVGMAAEAGLHRFVLSVLLPWPGEPNVSEWLLEPIERVLETDPSARLLLGVKLDPPANWLEANPEAAVRVEGGPAAVPCIASAEWLEGAKAGLETMISALDARRRPIDGVVLECLEDGRWYRTGPPGAGEADQAAFRGWLKSRYHEDGALQTAWGNPEITLDTASVPQPPSDSPGTDVFWVAPVDTPHVDYQAFTAQATAGAIEAVAKHVKAVAAHETLVLVPYGYCFEMAGDAVAHFALSRLLETSVDGFVSPVSYHDRGLGGVGGFMGPVDSVRWHGKQWYVVDDTRTGIRRDATTGALNYLAGLRSADVYNVQARNFAAVLTHGLGMFWSDPEGRGALLDPQMWTRFGTMQRTYARVWNSSTVGGYGSPLPERVLDPNTRTTLCVVVDEASRFYQRTPAPINRQLLIEARDAASLVGVPAKFHLLQDLLEDRATPASVYLFLNAFCLNGADRGRLHDLLTRRTATAIWLYAPGYIDPATGTASAENIAATTGFQVKAFEESVQCGSVYQLEQALLIPRGEGFGNPVAWNPLFYIETEGEPDTTVLANYAETEKPSIAIKFLESGWGSVYLAEPALTVNLLKQILLILEEPIYVNGPVERSPDVVYFGPNLVALHGRDEVDHIRTLELPRTCAIQDLLDERVGWPQKRVLDLPLQFGETRIFELTLVLPERPGSDREDVAK